MRRAAKPPDQKGPTWNICPFWLGWHIDCPYLSRGFAQPAMTATADATDSSTVKKLIQTVEELQETIKQQADRIDQLETELAEHKDHTGREFADVRARITKTENQQTKAGSEDAAPGGEKEKTGSQDLQTPLERICSLPEHIADRELTANQERARFIAKDVRDYAEKAPAGLVVDSRTVKKVIAAAEGKRPHTQTVARVMEFLADLGHESVELIKRRGKKLIVVDPEVADRLAHHTCCDGEKGPATANGVIAGP